MAPNDIPPFEKLPAKQQLFVWEYLKDLNATQAAIRAGYSPKTATVQGSQLLTKLNPYIAPQQRAVLAKTKLSTEGVLQRISNIATADIRDYLTWSPNGLVFKNPHELTAEQAACIAEVSQTHGPHGVTLSFKFHDKMRALHMLGRHYKVWDPKPQSGGLTVHIHPIPSGNEQRKTIEVNARPAPTRPPKNVRVEIGTLPPTPKKDPGNKSPAAARP